MKILVTGTTGQVGGDLLEALAPLGTVVGVDRREMDLASDDAIRATLAAHRPDVIVNPAAHTAVDRAESEPELAMRINGTAPGVLAAEARRLGAWLVHYSTDYVFDGSRRTPYRETDPTGPVSVYGRTKLAGEQAIAASGCRHVILRTSWVYSLRGRNFLTTMHRLAAERDELRVVDDQVGAPTTSLAIAEATARIVAALHEEPAAAATRSGVYHMTCAGSTTWCEFARTIVASLDAVAAALGAPAPSRRPRVTPIGSDEYPTAARRPPFSVLDNGRLAQAFGVRLPDWRDAFGRLLDAAQRGHHREQGPDRE